MTSTSSQTKITCLLTITFVATVTAEVLSGSTTLSRIQNLILQFFLYGPAVILIREIALRFNKGWATILLLGLAFGLTLEGLVLQSLFNPYFLGNNISFGRRAGVNWVWLTYMPPFHAFWAISLPILLCELFFPKVKDERWCSNTILIIISIILLVICIAFHFIFIKVTKFNTSPLHLAVLAVCIIGLIVLALRLPRSSLHIHCKPAYAHWLVALVTFIAGALWYIGFDTIFMSSKPPVWVSFAGAPLILIIYFSLISRVRLLTIVHNADRFGLAAGLLLSECLFGYFATGGNTLDHRAQIVLVVLVVLMLIILYRQVNKSRKLVSVNSYD